MHIFNSKKLQQWVRRHLKISFFTHTILLLVIYSTDKQTKAIINYKCFEIMVKL